MEALALGYALAEAPCVDDAGRVYFSDVLGGGGVHRWSPEGGVETVLPKRRGIGGMCLHADGGLVVSGRDLIHVHEGESRALLALDGVTGFNDLTAGPDGAVYVGALRFRPFGGDAPVPGDVWRVGEAGEAEMLFAGIHWPNGIGFSPDGEHLYVSDYASGKVLVRRSSGAPEVFAETPSGNADGLAVDAEGGVWVALGSGGGIGRYSPEGRLEAVLDVPADFVSSLCFGGEDMRDLYVTSAGGLFRGRSDVPGLPVARASV